MASTATGNTLQDGANAFANRDGATALRLLAPWRRQATRSPAAWSR
jgi:hypothetical protein